MKDHYAVLALLGVGAIALIVYLMSQNNAAPAAAAPVADNSSAAPSYPNAQPIQLGNIDIGGSPLSITYNQAPVLPTVQLGPDESDLQGCECETGQNNCAEAGQMVTKQTVPQPVMQRATTDFNAFMAKPAPAAQRPQVTFSQAAQVPALGMQGVDVSGYTASAPTKATGAKAIVSFG